MILNGIDYLGFFFLEVVKLKIGFFVMWCIYLIWY